MDCKYLQDAGEAFPLVRARLAQVEGACDVGRAAVVLPACAAYPRSQRGRECHRMSRQKHAKCCRTHDCDESVNCWSLSFLCHRHLFRSGAPPVELCVFLAVPT